MAFNLNIIKRLISFSHAICKEKPASSRFLGSSSSSTSPHYPEKFYSKGELTFESLSRLDLVDVSNLISSEFTYEENLCKASGVYKCDDSKEEFVQLANDIFADGVSIVAREKGEPVGMAINKIILNCDKESFYDQLELKKQSVQDYAKFMSDLCKAHTFLKANVILHTAFLYVKKEKRNQGVGNFLVRSSKKLAEKLHHGKMLKLAVTKKPLKFDLNPGAYSLAVTNAAGQKIAARQKLACLNTIGYYQYHADKESYASIIQDSDSKVASLQGCRVPKPEFKMC